MKVLLVGNGAREHIIAEQVARSAELYAIMGKKNPGIARLAQKYYITDITNPEAVGLWAINQGIDVAFASPDAVLAAGVSDALEKAGIPIASPTKAAARIEWDKSYARNLMQKYRIRGSPIFGIVKTEKEALKFIKNFNNQVVVKPIGLTGGKGVRVAGDHFTDAKGAMAYVRELLKKDREALMEEKIEGEEFSLQLFSDGKRISLMPPVQDHKRAYEFDRGPNCYSEDTEVLSADGWKTFDKLGKNDKVMVYEPGWKIFQFQKPKEIYWMKYEGPMISFKNRDTDLLVTPNHRMLVQRRRRKKQTFVVEAGEYSGENYILQSAKWNGRAPKFFKLPAYKKHFRFKSLKIDFIKWVRFLALYLSEGYATIDKNGGGRVYICQSRKSNHFSAMKKILQAFPLPFTLDKKGFRINSVQLASYLRRFGSSAGKFIPEEIKNADIATINDFLKTFCMGDGDIHHDKMRICSGSWRLIGDIQEMVAKTGRNGIIYIDKRKTMRNPLNKKIYAANPVYSLEIKARNRTSIRKKHVKRVSYAGYVGCVNVANKFVLVRRNGRVAICGNTGGMGSYTTGKMLPFMRQGDLDEGRDISQTIVDAMRKEGAEFRGVLYTQLMCTREGVKLIEFNARFGDPEAMNVLSLLKTQFVEILQSISDGNLKPATFAEKASVVKYLVPNGYPEKAVTDSEISVDEKRIWDAGAKYYYASVYEKDGKICTTNSRAVAVLGVNDTLQGAEEKAEDAAKCVGGPLWHRRDIGTYSLTQKRVEHMRRLRA